MRLCAIPQTLIGIIRLRESDKFTRGVPLWANEPAQVWFNWRTGMPDVTVERRNAPRDPLVLAAELVELPRGARLSARTSDVNRWVLHRHTESRSPGFASRVQITHENEIFEAAGRIVYVSYGLDMAVAFTEVTPEQQQRLDRWLEAERREF